MLLHGPKVIFHRERTHSSEKVRKSSSGTTSTKSGVETMADCSTMFALRRAVLCPRLTSRANPPPGISPDKDVNFRPATAAFTVWAEPEHFVVLCPLTPPTRPLMRFLFIGPWLCLRLPSHVYHAMAWQPRGYAVPSASTFVLMVPCTGDLNPALAAMEGCFPAARHSQIYCAGESWTDPLKSELTPMCAVHVSVKQSPRGNRTETGTRGTGGRR